MNVNLSVVKRSTESTEDVRESLEENGFSYKSSVLGGRVKHLETDNGIGISLIDGPMGTLVLPSGPVRGVVMGEMSVGFEEIIPDVQDGDGDNGDNGNDGSRGSNAQNSYRV